MKKISNKEILAIIGAIFVYIMIANSRSIEPNPFIPGAVLAVQMIVIVLAGIIFGPRAGLLVGLFGTALNAFTPVGSQFEFASILPHAIMGWLAGYINLKAPSFIAALSLIVGHFLNLLVYILFGLMTWSIATKVSFWFGLGYEIIIGLMAIVIIVTLTRMVFKIKI